MGPGTQGKHGPTPQAVGDAGQTQSLTWSEELGRWAGVSGCSRS